MFTFWIFQVKCDYWKGGLELNIEHVEVVLQDETADKNSAHGRMKITIPIEPELETANRAQRIRLALVAILSYLHK